MKVKGRRDGTTVCFKDKLAWVKGPNWFKNKVIKGDFERCDRVFILIYPAAEHWEDYIILFTIQFLGVRMNVFLALLALLPATC